MREERTGEKEDGGEEIKGAECKEGGGAII